MPIENYVESIIIRRDNVHLPVGDPPTFTDEQCDLLFEFKGTLQLKQIIKSVQNATHNRHDYILTIVDIKKFKEIVD